MLDEENKDTGDRSRHSRSLIQLKGKILACTEMVLVQRRVAIEYGYPFKRPTAQSVSMSILKSWYKSLINSSDRCSNQALVLHDDLASGGPGYMCKSGRRDSRLRPCGAVA